MLIFNTFPLKKKWVICLKCLFSPSIKCSEGILGKLQIL